MRAELKRQSQRDSLTDFGLSALDGVEFGFPQGVNADGYIDLEALADVALEARKRWHRATDPSAR